MVFFTFLMTRRHSYTHLRLFYYLVSVSVFCFLFFVFLFPLFISFSVAHKVGWLVWLGLRNFLSSFLFFSFLFFSFLFFSFLFFFFFFFSSHFTKTNFFESFIFFPLFFPSVKHLYIHTYITWMDWELGTGLWSFVSMLAISRGGAGRERVRVREEREDGGGRWGCVVLRSVLRSVSQDRGMAMRGGDGGFLLFHSQKTGLVGGCTS